MSKDEKKKRSSADTARRIWLAGIGAYGRAFTEAQGALKDVTGKSSDVFDDLVQKGEMIEKVVEYKGKELLSKTGVNDLEVPSFDIDERIQKMRSRLSMGSRGAVSETLEDRLAAVEKKLDLLMAKIEAAETSKRSPKKKTASKKPAAKTERTPKPAPK